MSTSPARLHPDPSTVYSLPIRSKYPIADPHSDSCPSHSSPELLHAHAAPIRLDSLALPAKSSPTQGSPPGLVAEPLIVGNSDIDDDDIEEDDDGTGHFSVPVTAPGSVDLSTSPEQPASSQSANLAAGLASRRGFAFKSVKFDMAAVSFQNAPLPVSSSQQPTPQPHLIPHWLQAAVSAVMQVLNVQQLHGQQMKVLSQALPVPSSPGHNSTAVVQHVRIHTLPTRLTFINVLHALPGRFQLDQLPQTPPTTPGHPGSSQGSYFTARVFDTAVAGADHDEDNPANMALREHYLTAPESVELSIVERYVPPCSPKEADSMFHLYDYSLFTDRLVELSPRNGCLLFIYPTRKGGATFQSRLLGPVLTTTLREMTSIYGLTEDFAKGVDSFHGLRTLVDFEEMNANVDSLLADINHGVPRAAERLRGRPTGFVKVYGEAQQVEVATSVWVEWWLKQEKQRIRDAIEVYLRRHRSMTRSSEFQPAVSQSTLLSELMERIERRALELDQSRREAGQPAVSLEVGVFVVQRRGQ